MFDLAEFRKINKLTQTQAAEYFGCKQPFISQIEKGERSIPDDFISKIKADKIYIIPDFNPSESTTSNNSNMKEEIFKLRKENEYLWNEIERKNAIIDELLGRSASPNKQTAT